MLPSIHQKTHFKAATSVFLKSQLEGSLRDKSNYLSRALRDVSPSFVNQSLEAPKLSKIAQSPMSKPTPSIIKKDAKIDLKKHANVSFAEYELKSKAEGGPRSNDLTKKGEEANNFSKTGAADAITKTILLN